MRHPAVTCISTSAAQHQGGRLQSFQLHLGQRKHRQPWFPVGVCGYITESRRRSVPIRTRGMHPSSAKPGGAFCDPGFCPIASSRSSSTTLDPRAPLTSTTWGFPRQMPNPLLGTSRQMKDRMTGHYPLLASALHTVGTRLVGGEPPTEGDASRTGNSSSVGVGAHSGPPYTRHKRTASPTNGENWPSFRPVNNRNQCVSKCPREARPRQDSTAFAWTARPTGG